MNMYGTVSRQILRLTNSLHASHHRWVCRLAKQVGRLMMLTASALTNHWVVGRSSCRGHTSNGTDGCFKVLTWNHNGIKGKQFLPREKVAATGWQITGAVPKDPKKGIHTKWWEKDIKDNMKNIKSQEDFDKQLSMAGDKFTLAHCFSPSCRACKALHSKVKEEKYVHCIFNNFTIIKRRKKCMFCINLY
ncbi:hypothetical protein PAHAL_9G590600 [Panicum hallii]|uniref:Thioredoxin domain-containing protein n=1 Tax=Panicum hallii TaxID=206008 RepID=A0A2S3ITZ3_9POAL|nr:hypothetical protein PAHAL_9G590600 [Panicum hallii]